MRVNRARRAGGVSPLFPADTSWLTPAARLNGFTLVELLVVILIMVILTALAVWSVNFSLSAERSRSAARQVQSYLEGARNRAIYAREPRGVRFWLDTTLVDASSSGRTVNSMVFIGETNDWRVGNIHMERLNDGSPDSDKVLIIGEDQPEAKTRWVELYNKGLLIEGSRIKIPDNEFGAWYTVTFLDPNFVPTALTGNKLRLTTPYRKPANTPDGKLAFAPANTGPSNYRLELPPVVLPDQEPLLLPQGIVIDLDRSKLPSTWTTSTLNRLDVLFSPRGTVTGSAAAQGLLHFYIAETADIDRLQADTSIPATTIPANRIPSEAWADDAGPIGDRVIVTLFTLTGAISTHQVDPTDVRHNVTLVLGADNRADDAYRYAELGEVAGQ